MIPQGISSSETSSLSPEDSRDGNENGGSGSEDESPQDASGDSDSSSPDDNEGDDNGIGQTDEQELTSDNGETPTSTERQVQQEGDPIPDVDVTLCYGNKHYDYKLKKYVPSPKEGINTGNVTTTATSELMNQTGVNNNNSTEGDLIIKEE